MPNSSTKLNSFLNALNEIYPPFLTMMFLFPVISGMLIDYSLFDIRYIFINLLWIPLFTVPYNLIQKKWIYQFTCLLFFITSLLETGHWIILGGPITITSLLTISQTNLAEVIEFFDTKSTIQLIVLIPFFALFILALKYIPNLIKTKTKLILIVVVVLMTTVFLLENALHERFFRKGSPQVVKVVYSFIEQYDLYQEANKHNIPRKVEAISKLPEKKQTVVLIIGESASRRHHSIYGAIRNTNPLLSKRTDLIIFNNVISPYSNTINSVLSMLSISNIEQVKRFNESINLIDIFHSAGFKTYWISNQSPIGIWDNLVTVLANTSDYTKFVNTSSNSSFEAILTTSYDSKLFKPFQAVLNDTVSKKFIIVHLMGSHSSYEKRYPEEFKVFTGSENKEKTIAQYDNSIRYTDFILDSLLKIMVHKDFSSADVISSLIYLSDHGENVYDELDKLGHDYSGNLPNANVEVPFFVWISPSLIHLQKNIISVLKTNTNKPYMIDDLFHSVMDLNSIQSKFLEPKRSIFNELFDASRPRIMENGIDYDKK